MAWHYYFLKITLFVAIFIEFILLSIFYYCNMGENINIKTIKDLKTYLDDKIHQLASSESISDIKALVQEQSSLILKITKQSSHRKKK